ncbi:TIGR04282 family arsenosugar biosynthesis glycosyltransferase [bacterium AH-315-C07]|nr:TIGR04282 family arsenosugar biosynthesis glycosyltransferase [bacterium AH-315-C07]
MNKDLLLIFVKKPELGKVKTRLAESIGDMNALVIYKKLLLHTRYTVSKLKADKVIFYSESIQADDLWNDIGTKEGQIGINLGSKMENAFKSGFNKDYDRLVIIGSDCHEINHSIIDNAFEKLNSCDVVIGPSNDGGYYLLGMNKLHPLFSNKQWSHPTVLESTIKDCESQKLNVEMLQSLNDIDHLDDLLNSSLLEDTNLSLELNAD